MSLNTLSKRSTSRGVGLIEVLITLIVLAVGMLGAAAMQLNSLKFNQGASERSQAVFLAYEIADAMRANRQVALTGGYDLALQSSAPAGSNVNQLDLIRWRTALSERLPQGRGAVARNGSIFTVTVQWSEDRHGQQDDASTSGVDESLSQFIFQTEI